MRMASFPLSSMRSTRRRFLGSKELSGRIAELADSAGATWSKVSVVPLTRPRYHEAEHGQRSGKHTKVLPSRYANKITTGKVRSYKGSKASLADERITLPCESA